MAENSDAEPDGRGPGRPFPKGTSGNPGGRPRKFKALELAIEEAHAGPKALAVLDKLHELALGGDVQAAKMYLDRVLGPIRPKAETLPPLVPDKRSTEKIQTSIRGLMAGQVAALEEKARNEGLTEDELSVVSAAAEIVKKADQNLEQIRMFGSLGIGG